MDKSKVNKIIIFTLASLYSTIALNNLIKVIKDKDVVIFTSNVYNDKHGTFFYQLKKIFKRSGYHFLLYLSTYMVFYKIIMFLSNIINIIFFNKKRYISINKIAKLYGIPIIKVDDINAKNVIDDIYEKKPDLILSCIFDQIISEEVFSIPKYGTMNIHPGLLPDYRGPFPSIFAAINNENNLGVTVHYVDRTLDTGNIIDRRSIPFKKNKSILYHDVQLMKLGIDIMTNVIASIGIKNLCTLKQEGGRYYSYPKRCHTQQLRRNNVKLFSIFELFKLFF